MFGIDGSLLLIILFALGMIYEYMRLAGVFSKKKTKFKSEFVEKNGFIFEKYTQLPPEEKEQDG